MLYNLLFRQYLIRDCVRTCSNKSTRVTGKGYEDLGNGRLREIETEKQDRFGRYCSKHLPSQELNLELTFIQIKGQIQTKEQYKQLKTSLNSPWKKVQVDSLPII